MGQSGPHRGHGARSTVEERELPVPCVPGQEVSHEPDDVTHTPIQGAADGPGDRCCPQSDCGNLRVVVYDELIAQPSTRRPTPRTPAIPSAQKTNNGSNASRIAPIVGPERQILKASGRSVF